MRVLYSFMLTIHSSFHSSFSSRPVVCATLLATLAACEDQQRRARLLDGPEFDISPQVEPLAPTEPPEPAPKAADRLAARRPASARSEAPGDGGEPRLDRSSSPSADSPAATDSPASSEPSAGDAGVGLTAEPNAGSADETSTDTAESASSAQQPNATGGDRQRPRPWVPEPIPGPTINSSINGGGGYRAVR